MLHSNKKCSHNIQSIHTINAGKHAKLVIRKVEGKPDLLNTFSQKIKPV